MSDLKRLSFSLDDSLCRQLERLRRRERHPNRSEFIRDLIRSRLVEEEWQDDQEAVGTITIVYDHHSRLLSQKLTGLQHEHHDEILAATHIHLDSHICVEAIIVKGRAGRIREIAALLRQQKGVLHTSVSMSSTGARLA